MRGTRVAAAKPRMAENHRRFRFEGHRALLVQLQALERFLVDEPENSNRWGARLYDRLWSLYGHLTQHFTWEERSPLYTALPDQHERFRERIDTLRTEHQEMLSELTSLCELAKRGSDGEICVSALFPRCGEC